MSKQKKKKVGEITQKIKEKKEKEEKRKEKLWCLARWPGLPLLTDVGPAVRSWF